MKTSQEEENTNEISETFRRLFSFVVERRLKEEKPVSCNWAECVVDNSINSCKILSIDELKTAPVKLDDLKVEVQDSLDEVNLGDDVVGLKPVFISSVLSVEMKIKLVSLLSRYKDCFAWSYDEMPGLDRALVEHKLPIKPNFKPFKQLPRRMGSEVMLLIKEEIEKLLKAGFIRTIRYAEWMSNIIPVIKKNGKIRVCIDFRNLNAATPKDEYPMPVADLLIDSASKHEIMTFMDGHAGYNQIFVAEQDTHKTAFRCPGAIGTFEWIVMPFGLKNAGATYQRAMNLIFHDLIGKNLEVYIDDVVIKSHTEKEHLEHLEKALERMRNHGLKMNPLKCAFGVSAGNFLGFLVHHEGIEIDKNKAKAIQEAKPSTNKKELQRFLGQVNFLRRFIANLAGKAKQINTEITKTNKSKIKLNKRKRRRYT